jgi:hypothetical protein
MQTYDPSDRGDVQRINNARDAAAARRRDSAERLADANGLRNQRLAELTLALSGLNSDAWRGLDPAKAAERVLPVLEGMMR